MTAMFKPFRAPSPVAGFRESAANPYMGADKAFIIEAISIIDGGGRIDDERLADMRVLIDVYLADTGQESLGWLREGIAKGERRIGGYKKPPIPR
ncbi:hypothetical protein MHZ92_14420 [Sporosarcina sp. ACRSL]|uniref:hypothetical protein n=1 Tax=Sporosarcina sp. ACRSL TaxID=2918215 RepID=UPI001EF495DD|nr:hypothetical protein [Sporosarcina sp. ACRSL]MCG7345331.1 hypothetical protein [Sporosarcina sp. ACRSL]